MDLMIKEFKSISSAVKDLAGENVRIERKTPVYGGDINDAWKLYLSDGSSLFMKTNSTENFVFFRKEFNGLVLLKGTACIGVPEIYGIGRDSEENCSFLLMEFLECPYRCENYWRIFGMELAEMHNAAYDAAQLLGTPNAKFGFYEDNYIGAGRQKNSPADNWIAFYRDCRLLPQIKLAERYLDSKTLVKLDGLLEHLDKYLREPTQGSIIHGDLWGGNVITGNDEKAWLIDPAVYIGDSEADLAMTQLFGNFPAAFYQAYHEIKPISPDYKYRKPMYHLYHMLNHLNLFGRGYLGDVISIVDYYRK